MTLAAAQVPPGWMVKVDPGGNWSFVATLLVCPMLPGGAEVLSLTASMIATVAAVLLLPPAVVPPLVSLAAPVVPVRVTATGVVSLPPAVPGVR